MRVSTLLLTILGAVSVSTKEVVVDNSEGLHQKGAVQLEMGDTLKLLLKSNRVTGYSWSQVHGSENEVDVVDMIG